MRLLQLAASFLLLSTFLSGQSLEKPTISLGEALVHPLEETSLPLQLSGLEGETIVSLRLEIQFWISLKNLFLSHPGVGDSKQQSLLDTSPDFIDIDTACDIVVGGLSPDL